MRKANEIVCTHTNSYYRHKKKITVDVALRDITSETKGDLKSTYAEPIHRRTIVPTSQQNRKTLLDEALFCDQVR
jgi:hypothetical protein